MRRVGKGRRGGGGNSVVLVVLVVLDEVDLEEDSCLEVVEWLVVEEVLGLLPSVKVVPGSSEVLLVSRTVLDDL